MSETARPRDPATKRNLTGEHPERAPHNPRQRQPGEGLTLTPEITEKICQALRIGGPLHTAGAYAGIGHATFDNWLREGRRGNPLYAEFIEAIELALAEGQMRDLARIDHAGDKDWRSLAWKLERRFPNDFADASKSGVNVNVSLAAITQSPDWIALCDRIVDALARFPDALEAVLSALGDPEILEAEAVEELTP